MKIKFFILTFIILSIEQVHAQQKMFKSDFSYNIFDVYANWGIQADPLAYFSASITRTQGDIELTPQYSFGYKFGLVYNFNFTNHFSLKVGALVGRVPAINTYFKLKNTDIGELHGYEHQKFATYSPFNFSFPVLLEYRNFMSQDFIFHLDAGIQIDRTSAAIILESVSEYGYNTSITAPGSWDVDPIIKLGFYYRFYKFMLQSNIVYKYKLKNQYEGNYIFANLNNHPIDTKGSYIQKGDYIGLSFTFYPRTRKRCVDNSCVSNTHSRQVRKKQRAIERAERKRRKKQMKMLRKEMRKKIKRNRKK